MEEQIEQDEINYDDVIEIKEEFNTLEKNKREAIKANKESLNQDTDRCNALTGSVSNIKRIDDTKTKITVDYIIDGEIDSETFVLNRPKNKDEFTVDNKFVRMVNFFGDRKNDPTSLPHRDVWLKYYEDENVKLHIPDSLNKKTIWREKLKRKLVSNGVSSWNSSITGSVAWKGATSLIMLSVAIFAFIGLATATTLQFAGSNLMFGFLGVLVIGMMLLLFLPMFNEETELKVIKSITFVSIIVCIIAGLGIMPDMHMPVQEDGFTSTLGNLVVSTSILVTIISAGVRGIQPVTVLSETVLNTKSRIKKWYNKKRGIEYIKTE